jgi:hypothetical protein
MTNYGRICLILIAIAAIASALLLSVLAGM